MVEEWHVTSKKQHAGWGTHWCSYPWKIPSTIRLILGCQLHEAGSCLAQRISRTYRSAWHVGAESQMIMSCLEVGDKVWHESQNQRLLLVTQMEKEARFERAEALYRQQDGGGRRKGKES